ncbi:MULTISPECIES: hypothetical protein [Bacillus cereus group]|uniref:Guanylate cyclase domain-containing protein n=2 Tax=Bacillus cereus group TaxID=86661 RepID=A0A2C1DRM4_BACCE|nr:MULTISPECIES: hypothetical protein [Bacillus cereus group]OFD71177.1 hypothetical protein BWGOE9_52230 [Bacillus mycoides]OFD71848.1 hypothetical protein BWGOE8_51180 [Bacillus mycoides]OFD74801.1 hypothetical protein BWGOE10_51800 [Bacillus mycoides]PGT02340.1 hypothetical protein COD09_12290 [Bacillus cereus]
MNSKGTKYRSIISTDKRYRIHQNPLYFILNENQNIFKSAEYRASEQEVQRIIELELEQDFKIGGHVDFDYLLDNIKEYDDFNKESNQQANVKLCSLFVDLRNFTRRALFVNEPGIESIQEIANLKQKAISTWIKLARFYQAHIHSITGDGLMILIGGTQPEDADDWTLGARAYLLALRILETTDTLNEELKQILIEKGKPTHAINHNNLLDIKVGVEFSSETLMNPQGVVVNVDGVKKAVGEIKATAFEIDFSAKLLGHYNSIKTNKIEGTPKYGRVLLMGERYKELMNFIDEASIVHYANYEKQMFDVKQSRKVLYRDCKDHKDSIITIDEVAALCNVHDISEQARMASIHIAREEKTQHG